MCFYLLHAIITESLSAAASAPIEIIRMNTKRKKKNRKMMCLYYHLMMRNNKEVILKMSKIQIKIMCNFKVLKTTYHFEEEAGDRSNGRKHYFSSK